MQRNVRLPGLAIADAIRAACQALIDAGWLGLSPTRTGFQHMTWCGRLGHRCSFDADAVAANLQVDEISATAHSLGMVVKEIKLSARVSQAESDDAFASLARERVGALFVAASANFAFNVPDRLVQLPARYGFPTIYEARDYCEIGGLTSYGASIPDIFHQIGLYAGRILKGEKAGELPVQIATKFEFVINLKTPKALGLTIPPNLLALADEVIKTARVHCGARPHYTDLACGRTVAPLAELDWPVCRRG
jgi:ABC transporter substrate binding protein